MACLEFIILYYFSLRLQVFGLSSLGSIGDVGTLDCSLLRTCRRARFELSIVLPEQTPKIHT